MTLEQASKELELSKANIEADREYINSLNRNIDKVRYLRNIKKYTQVDASEMIGISLRQVQRIDKKIKELENGRYNIEN